MEVYYSKKEREDLAKCDEVNGIIQEAKQEMANKFNVGFNGGRWFEVLCGAVTFTEALLTAYLIQHHTEKGEVHGTFGDIPTEVKEFGEVITARLGKLRFRWDVIIRDGQGTPVISAERIKSLYPKFYTLEVAELTSAQIAERKEYAEAASARPGSTEGLKYLFGRAAAFSTVPRAGFRESLKKGKDGKSRLEVTFSEVDYYLDTAKTKLNL